MPLGSHALIRCAFASACSEAVTTLLLMVPRPEAWAPQARVDAGSEAAADDGMLTVVERMLGEGPGLWRSKKVALQSGSELALVEGGGLQSVTGPGDLQEEGEVPHICEVSHKAVCQHH